MRVALAAGFLLVALPGVAAVHLVLDGPLVAGTESQLRLVEDELPLADVEVKAVYRENAHDALRKEQVIGRTDDDGRLSWTPEQAGVVVLQWEGGTLDVSVLYDGTPPGGVLIAVFAGLALIGGSVLFFLAMLRQDGGTRFREVEAEEGQPPST